MVQYLLSVMREALSLQPRRLHGHVLSGRLSEVLRHSQAHLLCTRDQRRQVENCTFVCIHRRPGTHQRAYAPRRAVVEPLKPADAVSIEIASNS